MQLAQRVEPAAAGQQQVEDHQVVAAGQRPREPLLAVADHVDPKPSASNARARKARMRASSSTINMRICSFDPHGCRDDISRQMTCK